MIIVTLFNRIYMYYLIVTVDYIDVTAFRHFIQSLMCIDSV